MPNVIWRRRRCFKASLVPTQIWAPEMIERKRDLARGRKGVETGSTRQLIITYVSGLHTDVQRYYIIFYAGNGGQRFFFNATKFYCFKIPRTPIGTNIQHAKPNHLTNVSCQEQITHLQPRSWNYTRQMWQSSLGRTEASLHVCFCLNIDFFLNNYEVFVMHKFRFAMLKTPTK